MEVQNEIVKFQPNIPVRLKLRFDNTKPSKSQFSQEDQFMLSAEGNKLAYLTPYCNQKLVETGAKRGDVVEICKRTVQQGQRQRVEWAVAKVTEEVPPPPVAPAVAPAETTVRVQEERSSETTPLNVPAVERTQVFQAIKATLLACQHSEKLSLEIGYPVKWDKDDIRTIATTVLIGMQREVRS